jgi:hypothetical protein
MFEDFYPECAASQEQPERYSDVPLGVEAAWPSPAETADERDCGIPQ